MIKIENVDVYGWDAAIRGMRNPKNSWEKSDSYSECEKEGGFCSGGKCFIGKNDLALMQKLSAAGDDHGKFLRMLTVTLDITAPLYWWKEFDTYKVGTVANSCSTMHTLTDKEFKLSDFSHEHLCDCGEFLGDFFAFGMLECLIDCLNKARKLYLETNDKIWWWQIIQLLPTSYNQRRTVQLNYQVLKTMYNARKYHKLDEWRDFCDWITTLDYANELIVGSKKLSESQDEVEKS